MRRDWLEEWRSELWHEARRRGEDGQASGDPSLLSIASGAFADVRAARTYLAGVPDGGNPRDGIRGRSGGTMRELRISLRSLSRSPGFAVIALITLSLGIGATSALFTVVDAVLLEPLPYAQPDGLVTVSHPAPGIPESGNWPLSQAGYMHFAANNRTLENLGVYRSEGVNLAEEGEEAERLRAAIVSTSLLDVLRAVPATGRVFTEADDERGAPLVVLLNYDLWQTRYGGDPSVIGRVLRVNGSAYEVVGVLAKGFELPTTHVDLWLPMQMDRSAAPVNSHYLSAIGRLRDGATEDAAEQELLGEMNRFTELFPSAYSAGFMRSSGFGMDVSPLRDQVLGDVSRVLWILLGAVSLVLLIACANVANLFLVRGEARRRELAVRAALGAGRSTIARLFFVETILLSLLSGLAGLGLAWAAVRVLVVLSPAGIPRLAEIGLDGTSVLFAALAAVLAGIAFAFISMLRFGANPAFEVVKESGRGMTPGRARHATRSAMVVAQVAMALVLLSAAGLLWRSFERLRDVRPGFDAQGVLVFDLSLPFRGYSDETDTWAFYERLIRDISALPGVTAVGASNMMPLDGQSGCYALNIEAMAASADAQPPCVPTAFAMPGYFEAMGIRVDGRSFEMADFQNRAGVAVISRSLAERFWPGEDPIGKGFKPFNSGPPYYRVIGVADDVHANGLDQPAEGVAYFPILPMAGQPAPYARYAYFAVRTNSADPMSLLPAVRRTLSEINPEVPVGSARTMDAIVQRSMHRTSFAMLLLGIAAGIALLLGAVGLFGVISYVVGQRRAEIGVRMALGARTTQVGSQVVWQALRLALIGIVIGITASLLLAPMLGALLFQIEPADPVTLAGVSLLLLATAGLAAWLPAWRATRINPVEALRTE
jgi:predicted permease